MELDVLSPSDIKLEDECPCLYKWQSSGKFIKLARPDSNCPRCQGTGKEPTQFGQDILDFMQKHLKKD